MPPVFCIISLRRSRGKTALLEWLVKELSRRGMKVATIKHSREPIDLRGKDTYRHLEAGALEVVYASSTELVTMRRVQSSIRDAINSLHVKPDLILVEGFKESTYPKILCVENLEEARKATGKISNLVAVVPKSRSKRSQIEGVKVLGREEVLNLVRESVIKDWMKRIPGLNCGKCEYGSCAGLAEAIKRGEATIRECVMRRFHAAKILIDGDEVPLGPWPQQLLRELVKAFIKSLKLRGPCVEDAERIFLEVRLK